MTGTRSGRPWGTIDVPLLDGSVVRFQYDPAALEFGQPIEPTSVTTLRDRAEEDAAELVEGRTEHDLADLPDDVRTRLVDALEQLHAWIWTQDR